MQFGGSGTPSCKSHFAVHAMFRPCASALFGRSIVEGGVKTPARYCNCLRWMQPCNDGVCAARSRRAAAILIACSGVINAGCAFSTRSQSAAGVAAPRSRCAPQTACPQYCIRLRGCSRRHQPIFVHRPFRQGRPACSQNPQSLRADIPLPASSTRQCRTHSESGRPPTGVSSNSQICLALTRFARCSLRRTLTALYPHGTLPPFL